MGVSLFSSQLNHRLIPLLCPSVSCTQMEYTPSDRSVNIRPYRMGKNTYLTLSMLCLSSIKFSLHLCTMGFCADELTDPSHVTEASSWIRSIVAVKPVGCSVNMFSLNTDCRVIWLFFSNGCNTLLKQALRPVIKLLLCSPPVAVHHGVWPARRSGCWIKPTKRCGTTSDRQPRPTDRSASMSAASSNPAWPWLKSGEEA